MKRRVCFLLAFVMLLVMSCGCSDKTAKKTDISSDNTFSIMGSPNYPTEKETDTEKWLEEKYGIKLEVHSVTTSYYEKLSTMLASDEIPDVMFINEPENWQPLVKQGFVAKVSKDLIKKYAPNHYNAIEAMNPNIWAISSVDGENWVVPKIMCNEYGTAMIWRKDWLENVGITKTPESIEEFEDAFKKMRENDPDGNGKKDTYGLTGAGGATQRQFDIIFGAFGVMPGQWIVTDGKVENSTTSERAKEALQLLHSWYENDLIDPEMITDTQDDHFKKFMSGRVGSMNTSILNVLANSASGLRNKETFESTNPGLNWENCVVAGSLPVGADGMRGDWLWGPRANFAVFGERLEESEEQLGTLLKMFDDINYDEETALRVVWGEKGVTYDYIDADAGKISGLKYLPPYDSDSNERAKKGIYGFFNLFAPASGWADGSIVTQYTDPALIEEQKAYSETERYKDSLMRPYLKSSARYQAELDKLKTTAYSEFITGARSIEEWDDFVEEYMRKGGEQLQKEAQEFYETNMK